MPTPKIMLSIVFLLAAAFFGCKYLFDKGQAESSLNWPHVDGVVASSKSHSASHGRGATYYPEITYIFDVDRHTFESNRIGFPDPNFGSEQELNTLLGGYSQGRHIRVYYDPRDAHNAVLLPGTNSALYYEIVWCGGLIALAIGSLFIPSQPGQYVGGRRYQGPAGYITPSD
jgi:hypothetical protein